MTTDSAEEALTPGSIFAGYEIVRRMGAGDFGAVYEAVKQGGGPRVALKVLRVEMQGNEEIVVRFMREARAVALLKHPNIVAAVEVGECDGKPFLAMEHLKGELLGELVSQSGGLPLREALDLAIPLMSAVRAVHAQGIVHRDLKPENIFVAYTDTGEMLPKILDFGFAKMAEPGLQLTGKDTAIGTPNFMSPEQMLSPRSVDPRSDQWALGVLLYYMLTGDKPFEGRNLADTLRNVLQSEPAPLRDKAPDVPEVVANAVARAMKKPPDQRFPTVHDFALSLVKYASDETALFYAQEFYTVSVWDALGEEPPPRTGAEERARPPRSPRKVPSSLPPGTSGMYRSATSSKPPGSPSTLSSPAATSSRPSITTPSTKSSPAATSSRPPASNSKPPSSTPPPAFYSRPPSTTPSRPPRSATRSQPPVTEQPAEPLVADDPVEAFDDRVMRRGAGAPVLAVMGAIVAAILAVIVWKLAT